MKTEEYVVKNSTKYIFLLFIVASIILIPSGILVGFIGISIMNRELWLYGLFCIFMSVGCFCTLYFVFRYQIGTAHVTKEAIFLSSPIAKKIYIRWEDCKLFGAICKIQNIGMSSVGWLYFGKKLVNQNKIFSMAPQSNKNIIFVAVNSEMLLFLKNYLPTEIYIKIYTDLITKGFPMDNK